MTPLPVATAHPKASTQPWAQTSFLTTDPEPALDHDASREAMEALRAADQAVDVHSQRRALDRLARHLSQQAHQRGRTPVPKRPS
jgi:phage-related minor tail protein